MRWDAAGITAARGEHTWQVPGADPAPRLDLVLAEFTAALDEQRTPSVDLTDNIKTLQVVLAMIRSSEAGGPVEPASL